MDEVELIDDAALAKIDDEGVVYQITSFGADFLVDGLVSRLDRGDIYTPAFQRQFVWTVPQASKFVESILLGLPIPGIFLYREEDTQKHLIIDGLQRLTTIHAFQKGHLPNSDKVFRLTGVKRRFEDRTLDELEPADQRRFRDATIHATVIQQSLPEGDNSSVYQIFDRLNSGGTPLQPQEIRAAIYHGKFQLLLEELNKLESWRSIFGPPNKRGKDQELILRFLALYAAWKTYKAPMQGFLNTFMQRNRMLDDALAGSYTAAFASACEIVVKALGPKPFRPVRALNVAVFDSVMVAIASMPNLDTAKLSERYAALLADDGYIAATSKSTSDESNVRERIELAKTYLAS